MSQVETLSALRRYLVEDRTDAQFDPMTETIRFTDGDRGVVAPTSLLRQACDDLARDEYLSRRAA